MSLLARYLARSYGLPPVENRVRTRHHRVPVGGGVELATDVHLPVTDAPRATVLMRSPYGRRGTWGWLYGRAFAERGYVAVAQSTRGGYGSGGAHEPMVRDRQDGLATVDWMRGQPWFTGDLVLVGASYLAWCAWATATGNPPELRAIVSHVGPHEWASVHRPGGSIDLETMMLWTAEQLGPERADSLLLSRLDGRRRPEPDLSLLLTAPQRQGITQLLGGEPRWVTEWLDHERADRYWDSYDASAALETVTCPVLVIGGQHDLFFDQSWRQVERLEQRGVPVDLVMGSWTHRQVKDVWPTLLNTSLGWLGDVLDGSPVGGRRSVFDTGSQQWTQQWTQERSQQRTEATDLDAPQSSTWHLSGGRLTSTPPVDDSVLTWRHEPHRPVPALGGARFSPDAGAAAQNEIEERGDVVTFTSEPFGVPVTLHGRAVVRVCVMSEDDVWDLVLRLCDVAPDGISMLVTDAIQRTVGASAAPTTVTLGFRVHTFDAGHRLRLQLASSSHPRWQHGTGAPLRQHDAVRPAASTLTLRAGASCPSVLTLPLRASAASAGAKQWVAPPRDERGATHDAATIPPWRVRS